VTAAEWIALVGQFMLLSPLAVGGGLTVAPGVHKLLVTRYGLITDAQFSTSIAIAQISPGPNVLYVAVAGYQAAGLGGATAALLGVLLPSSVITFAAGRWARDRQHLRAVRAFRAGIGPISVGLLGATTWILAADAPGWRTVVAAGIATVVVWRTRVHLLWIMAAGAVAGVLGWI
jgi:chromate transporter